MKFFDLDHKLAGYAISRITNLPGAEYILTSHFGVSKNYKQAVDDWHE